MYRHRRAFTLAASSATVLLAACSTLNVTSDVADKGGMARCHIYSWADATAAPAADPAQGAFANPVNDGRLRDAIADNLSRKGLVLAADSTSANCLVDYAIGSRSSVDGYARSRWSVGLGVGSGWGRGGFGSVAFADQPSTSREGRIAVNIYDAGTHQPLWHAWVNTDVTQMTGDDAAIRINAAVVAIFAKYPQ